MEQTWGTRPMERHTAYVMDLARRRTRYEPCRSHKRLGVQACARVVSRKYVGRLFVVVATDNVSIAWTSPTRRKGSGIF
jgi:hypothetical protein